VLAEHGPAAGFAYAIDELAALFGSDIRRSLRPLALSNWTRMDSIGGGYSYALPGKSEAGTSWLAHSTAGCSSPARQRTATTSQPLTGLIRAECGLPTR
jgi:hypothetical protein